ncbi:hypothetical protein D3H55_07035 [Bacillus salacetis]|uniref:Uncharacterized protein n=1 Tax=Bacillus salacetis TaxID=2315464 RepID=A0A3A1R1Y1_9BACI|nr:CBO0543 family protein [Bacillus salacetis]RIW35632.1 hypothetical protein D3H55_07035 [Bacillus salacetis]
MFEKVEKSKNIASELEMNYWLNDNLFSLNWWVVFILNFLFLILFIILIDRQRILLVSLVFTSSFILVSSVDEIGNYFGLWSYRTQFLAFFEAVNAVDFLTVPVIITLIYQFFTSWKSFIISSLIGSALIGFIFVPIFVYFEFYKLNHWNYFYSFLTLFIIGLIVKVFSDFIHSKSISQS